MFERFRIPLAGWLAAGPLPVLAQSGGPNPGVEPTVYVVGVIAFVAGVAVGYVAGKSSSSDK
jgi:hypothetical protein